MTSAARVALPIVLFFLAAGIFYVCREAVANAMMAMNLQAMTGIPADMVPMIARRPAINLPVLAFSYWQVLIAAVLFGLVIRFGMGPALNFLNTATYAMEAAVISPALAAAVVTLQLSYQQVPPPAPRAFAPGGLAGSFQALALANQQPFVANQIARLVAVGLILIWYAAVLRREKNDASKPVPTGIGLAILAFLFG